MGSLVQNVILKTKTAAIIIDTGTTIRPDVIPPSLNDIKLVILI